MYTNYDFLNVGQPWIPRDEDFCKRLEIARTGRLLYDGDFLSVFKETWQAIASRYGQNWKEVEQVLIKMNLFKKWTETYEDLIFGDLPKITSISSEKVLGALVEETDFMTMLTRAFISGHAQGTGVFKVILRNGKPLIRSVNPEIYIPVYSEDDMDVIQAHVLASKYKVHKNGGFFKNERYDEFLKVEINEIGKVITRVYEIKNDKLASLVSEEEKTYDKWDDFLVFTFDFGHPNWREYALSQYDDIISIVDELIVRASNNSKILDDHADPQLITPESALEFDSNSGQHIYKRHQALTLGKDGDKPEYLTWDGNLEASEKQIDRMMEFYYLLTTQSAQLFGKDIAGNLSGDALTKILIMPIRKAKKLALALERVSEKALNCALTLIGATPDANVEFEIGSFNTLEDVSNRAQSELRSGASSIERAVRDINPRYTDEEVAKEVEAIKADKDTVSNMADLVDPNTGQVI